ncbi:MAG: 5-formyltetrahydrofolate cyclo-ligase, partial [Pseudomonadota bacterium]
MSDELTRMKAQARKTAFERRKAAFQAANAAQSAYLSEVLAGYRGVPIAGYSPMRTEIDPLPAMAEAAAHGPVGMPVIQAAATPLEFCEWTPGCVMVPGTFGASVPEAGAWVEPEI